MKKMKIEKGITLISLVVTIIILIILAGISINLLFGDTGIITKAKNAKKEQDIVRIGEKLELEKAELAVKEYGKLDVNKYLDQIKTKGIIEEIDIDRINEESVNIIVEGKYVFLVEKEDSNNIKIEYLGESGNLIPKIQITLISNTTNSITINFKLTYAVKYRLLIKEEGEEYRKEKEEILNTKQISYTFNNLNQSSTYTIKIEAESEKGAKAQKEESIEMNTILTPNITVADASIWTTSKNVTITTASGYTTKYTIDGTIPSATNGTIYTGEFTVNSNCIITAVYLDSIDQVGEKSENTITKIDAIAPTKATIDSNGYTSGKWTNANVTMSFNTTETLSGVAYYQYSHDGINAVASIPNPWTINWDGQWNFYVRAIDNAGNIGEWSDVFTIRRDASAPQTLDIKLTPSKTSIKVDITQAADATSGIAGYRFSKDNGVTWTGYQTGTSYTFTNLYGNLAGVTCTIKVETKDNAGNIKQIAKNATTTCLNTSYYKNYTFNLCTLNGRKYYKTSSEGTINAIAYYINNGHWTNVLTIGNTESSVSNTCDYDNKVHNKWTINYNGTIYYCSNEHALTNPRSISSNIAILNSYNSEYSSLDAVYRALLDRYYQ